MGTKSRTKEYGGEDSTYDGDKDTGEYEECPFCGVFYEVYKIEGREYGTLNDHIKTTHDKVRVRKGSNYRWVDRNEVLKNLGK